MTFQVFAGFLSKEAKIACDPVTSSVQPERDRGHNRSYKRTSTSGISLLTQAQGAKQKSQAPRKVNTGSEVDPVRSFHTSAGKPTRPSCDPDKLAKVDKDRLCLLCKEPHDLDCAAFHRKSLSNRKTFIKQEELCFACLTPHHRSRECRCRKTCAVCSKHHPTSLHEY